LAFYPLFFSTLRTPPRIAVACVSGAQRKRKRDADAQTAASPHASNHSKQPVRSCAAPSIGEFLLRVATKALPFSDKVQSYAKVSCDTCTAREQTNRFTSHGRSKEQSNARLLIYVQRAFDSVVVISSSIWRNATARNIYSTVVVAFVSWHRRNDRSPGDHTLVVAQNADKTPRIW
jgi:hypothetical protein